MRRDFGLEEFKASAIGKRVQKIIEDPEQIRDMEAFSRHEIPAVIAIGKALLVSRPANNFTFHGEFPK
jgi:hypothetical protein